MGVMVAFLIGLFESSYGKYYDAHDGMLTSLSGEFGPWLSLGLFAVLAFILYRNMMGGRKTV